MVSQRNNHLVQVIPVQGLHPRCDFSMELLSQLGRRFAVEDLPENIVVKSIRVGTPGDFLDELQTNPIVQRIEEPLFFQPHDRLP
jgi:hypothetical protein